jgi:hypothetical protein
MITTIVRPLFSGRLATLSAAATAAPEEIPTKIPSSSASRLDMAIASDDTLTASSTIFVSRFLGMNPAPWPGPSRPARRQTPSGES